MMGKPVILVGNHYWQRYNWWDTFISASLLVAKVIIRATSPFRKCPELEDLHMVHFIQK